MKPIYLLSILLACTPGSYGPVYDTGDGASYNNGDNNQSSSESTSTWMEIHAGSCYITATSDGGMNWTDLDWVGITARDEPVRVYGGVGQMLQVECDGLEASFGVPEARFDSQGCPVVYCNPNGGSNKTSGEAENCRDDLWVYLSPESDTRDWTQCGPWDLLD